MSRVGKAPVTILEGVTVTIEDGGRYGGQKVVVQGPLGTLEEDLRKDIKVKTEDGNVIFERKDDTKFAKSLHGLYRTLTENMIKGVKNGYEKMLEIVGIGYRAELKGNDLELKLGATHPYLIKAPEEISFEVHDKVSIVVKGVDKQLVG